MTANPEITYASTYVPIMHWRAFAAAVGITEGTVRGLCNRGYLPVVNIGKHRFINLAKLNQQCLQGAE